MVRKTAPLLAASIFIYTLCLQAGAYAAGYNPIIHQAQSALAAKGFDPGSFDGYWGPKTRAATNAYQQSAGLAQSSQLDEATLASLAVGTATGIPVKDWRAVPAQAEIDTLVSTNDANRPYADYRQNVPGANLDIPGQAILEAMQKNADTFGSRRPGEPKHTEQGYKYMTGCLKTQYAPTHWSDLTLHYYCQMSKPRACYTLATSGRGTPGNVPLSRTEAYRGCAAGTLQRAEDFAWVTSTQPLVFQYVMFGQTHAFNHEQEQAVINAFYGVQDPTNRRECNLKRPRRTEDPRDGTHCLVNKYMGRRLVGRNR
ncbi:MAG: peptidoglycan-binding protein [Methylococcaceae bacterium]|nr:peptidoglycan-binding protein [Methylococcaceae bacterium]